MILASARLAAVRLPLLVILAWLVESAIGQNPPSADLAISPVPAPLRVDGDLSDWPADCAMLSLRQKHMVTVGADTWGGEEDCAGDFRIAYDANHLYVGGLVVDDRLDVEGQRSWDEADCIELTLGFGADERDPGVLRADEERIFLMPMRASRPWGVVDLSAGAPRQSSSLWTGLEVAGQAQSATTYVFEAAIPFHHFRSLRRGARVLGFNLALHDRHDGGALAPTTLTWNGRDPLAAGGLGRLRLADAGALAGESEPSRLLSPAVLADLPWLLVPLGAVGLLLLVSRTWSWLRRQRAWWWRALIGAAVCAFAIGFWLPSLEGRWRVASLRREADELRTSLAETIARLEAGTLASYRGQSRDRALLDLLAGNAIARQKYTSYRPLAEVVRAGFGPAVREYPEDFPVRPVWLPLPAARAEALHFDPPLAGEALYLVFGRPFAPSPSPLPDATEPIELQIETTLVGQSLPTTQHIALDSMFVSGAPLGRPGYEVASRRLGLDGDLRTLSLRVESGTDVRLVGLSLLPRRGEVAVPLSLGTPSLGGVMTDLRGPHPADAGLELGANATARIEIPAGQDLGNKLWLFYRATYPGVPAANPGARVAEVVLHFRDGLPPRTIVLEHQVSMFYELLVQNTRDQPPAGSPASVAFSWVDDTQEKHINMVYPVLDLPANVEFEAIEFRNLADYRMRFRSVVFGAEKAAAPQDPADSPLIREGQDRRLRQDLVAAVGDAVITIHREGRLSMASVPPEQCQDLTVLPRVATSPGPDGRVAVADLPGGRRRVSVFEPLAGDGWDGAVLGISRLDPQWAAARANASLLGMALCLLAAPILLLWFAELLMAIADLRWRLTTVLAVASLAPLTLLSLYLAQVIERGHASTQRDAVRQQVRSALQQLDDQKKALHGSANQWLQDLTKLLQARTTGVADAQLGDAVAAAMPELTKLLHGQLPPEWRGGFLQLDWRPGPGTSGRVATAVAGSERLASAEAAARAEPGIFVHWGQVLIGVRAEQPVRNDTLALTVGRPLGPDFLGALAPGRTVLLTDTKGYPLACAATPDSERLLRSGRDHAHMVARERALADAWERRQPIVERLVDGGENLLCGHGVLADLQDTPRALLVLASTDQRAGLDLPFGRLSVRAFFLLVAGLLAVLGGFLAFVVSGRISRPIERLEYGAQAISRGELDVRVPIEELGQIGRLSRTFNAMAEDLQARLHDLHQLNRTIQDLSAQLDPQHTLAVLRRFCEQHAAADRIAIALLGVDAADVRLHGLAEEPVAAPELQFVAQAIGSFGLQLRGEQAAVSRLVGACPGARSVVGIPLVYAGRSRGAVLLLFEREVPPPVDLALLSTVAAQAAVALENAELYHHAIQDPITGAYTTEYFRRRVADEISIAQQRGQPAVLLALMLGDGLRRPRGLRRFAALLREQFGEHGVLCHLGSGVFQVLVRGVDRAQGAGLSQRVVAAWRGVVASAAEGEVEERAPATALVAFPEEAASAEFLFDGIRERLQGGDALEAAAVESDESLQQAGVTAVSPAMREVYRTLRRVAGSDLTVLLEGETGTGKEVLSNLVHRWSRRAAGPMVKVHCAALSETLLASELFGHEKGAFTGADRRKIGKFEQANGGTLLLDEVGEISLDVQVKLLRVLQEREVDRVGGSTPVAVDVRVIAATNRDLVQMVREGRFREDLYYRLQGILVRVPPLRERRQEIPALVHAFLREVVAAGQSPVKGISTDAMDELFRRDWPGNVRELRNAVFRAVVLCPGEVVQLRDLLSALPPLSAPASGPVGLPMPAPAPGLAADGKPAEPVDSRRLEVPVVVTPNVEVTPPAVVIPRPEPSPRPADLPPRLAQLWDLLLAKGSLGTQEHIQLAGVSARTALRDMTSLMELGLVVRIGSRRGARYQPSGAWRETGIPPTVAPRALEVGHLPAGQDGEKTSRDPVS